MWNVLTDKFASSGLLQERPGSLCLRECSSLWSSSKDSEMTFQLWHQLRLQVGHPCGTVLRSGTVPQLLIFQVTLIYDWFGCTHWP